MPSELTEEIAGRLLRHDVSDYLRLRAACKAWRDCTDHPRDPLDARFRPRRWILLSNPYHYGATCAPRCRFLNTTTGACLHVDLPELEGHQIEARTDGLLVLRDKASGAISLLNPLTRGLTHLPSTSAALAGLSPPWAASSSGDDLRIAYAAISDETSPPTVALFIRGQSLWNIAYAKPGDEHWALIDHNGWNLLPNNQRLIRDGQQLRSIRYLSVVTHRGRIYFTTFQGNILRLRLHPKPRLVPIVKDQSDMVWDNGAGVLYENVISYLVEPEDTHNGRMLMVRYHQTLGHLSAQEQRRIKQRKKNNILIKQLINDRPRRYKWQVLQVFEVDLLGKRLVPVEDIGHRSLFVGDVACVSLSAHKFPSIYGNAVYFGMNTHRCVAWGLCHLKDRSVEPKPMHFFEDRSTEPLGPGRTHPSLEKIVPAARPCRLEDYLVCYVGFKNGIKD
uniref:KIB1-4 beta-propeller domain-containing protein n=1 Tax=Leersia perrieri TaxID=77586 RepID=A0A0D9W0K4_9ORYZ